MINKDALVWFQLLTFGLNEATTRITYDPTNATWDSRGGKENKMKWCTQARGFYCVNIFVITDIYF